VFNYPVEKYGLRFYKYKFLGFEENPITIEACNKWEARQMLSIFIRKHKEYHNVPIISETLSLPIFGETTKEINGIKHVWVGNLTSTFWMPLWEFEKLDYE
jgi:hypothetical protein